MASQQLEQPVDISQHLLRHGHIAATFGTYGEAAYCAFLKCALEKIPLVFSDIPGCDKAYAIMHSAIPHLPYVWHSADGTPVVLLDCVIDQTRGPIVSQEVWLPENPRVFDQVRVSL